MRLAARVARPAGAVAAKAVAVARAVARAALQPLAGAANTKAGDGPRLFFVRDSSVRTCRRRAGRPGPDASEFGLVGPFTFVNPCAYLSSALDAAIVDLDGTMVDTLGDFAVALNRMLGELGLPAIDARAIEPMVGRVRSI